MISLTGTGKALAIAFAMGAVAGLAGGWAFYRRGAPVAEPPAPAERQQDSSLVLRRADTSLAKPKVVPKGATIERQISATVQPGTFIKPDTVYLPATATEPAHTIIKPDTIQLPPVRFSLTYVEEKDHTHRVIASSPDGKVIDGIDVPVGAARAPPRVLVWSAGPLYNPSSKTWGGGVSRDLGPARILASLHQPDPALRFADGSRPAFMADVGVWIRF